MIDVSPLFGITPFCHISADSFKKIAHVETFTLLQSHILASFQSRPNSSFFRNISNSLLFFQDSKACIFLCRKVNKIYFSYSVCSGIEFVFKRYSTLYKKDFPVQCVIIMVMVCDAFLGATLGLRLTNHSLIPSQSKKATKKGEPQRLRSR